MVAVRNARDEAQARLEPGLAARVLEPSPPAVDDGDFYADDPVNAPVPPGAKSVGPAPSSDLIWDDWLAGHPESAGWAAARWLGGYRRLGPPPAALPSTRLALHRLAAYVISPARRRVNSKIGLRYTAGGFGTPFFGADEQVRVEGATLVRQAGTLVTSAPVTSLAAAAEMVLGAPPDLAWADGLDVPDPGDAAAPLDVDPESAAFLGDWYGLAWSVLEELRAEPESASAGRVQLWPEHFDAAFECLDADRRAGFGCSPGDGGVDEPYLYVVPWHPDKVGPDEVWNAKSFRGAVLAWSEIVGAPDQRGACLSFFRRCRAALGGST